MHKIIKSRKVFYWAFSFSIKSTFGTFTNPRPGFLPKLLNKVEKDELIPSVGDGHADKVSDFWAVRWAFLAVRLAFWQPVGRFGPGIFFLEMFLFIWPVTVYP